MKTGLTKQDLCDALVPVLRMTRNLYDLESLEYDPDSEIITAQFPGGKVWINVAMDSGTAMIRDIMKQIE